MDDPAVVIITFTFMFSKRAVLFFCLTNTLWATSLLRPGVDVKDRLMPGRIKSYRFDVSKGFLIRIVADQHEVDLTLRLRDPSGTAVSTSNTFDHGQESTSWIAEKSGIWQVDVLTETRGASQGTFRLLLSLPRPPRTGDRDRIEAEKLSTQVRILRRNGTAEAMREARVVSNAAIALWRSIGEAPSELRSSMELADIHHALNEYDEARAHYMRALSVSRSSKERRCEAEILNNLAMGYWQQGRMQEALEELNKSREVWESITISNGRGATLNNLGLLAWQTGDTREALQYYEDAQRVLRRTGHRSGEAYVIHNTALAYASLGDYPRSLDAFRNAVAAFLKVGDRLAAGRARSTMSKVHLLNLDVSSAARSIAQAFPEIEPTGDRRGLGDAFNHRAQVRSAENRTEEALDAGHHALTIFRQIGDKRGEAYALQTIGATLSASGRHALAIENLEHARSIFRSIGSREHEASSLCSIAASRRRLGELDSAHTLFQSAIDLIESIRATAPGDRLRLSFAASRSDCYEDYVDLLIQMGRARSAESLLAEAFETAERGRAQGIVALLRQRRWDIQGPVDAHLIESARNIQRTLSFSLERIGRLPEARHPEAKREIDDLFLQLQIAEDRIQAASPSAAVLFRPRRARLGEIQRAVVGPDTMLLEFALGRERSYLFAATSSSLDVYDLPRRGEIEALARTISEVLHRRQNPRTALARLGQMLLGPVAARLTVERLVIVPDGALHYVPFVALPNPASRVPLVVSHRIARLPSATTALELRESSTRRSPSANRLAIVADPVYGPDDSRVPAKLPHAPRAPYARLVFAGRAARAIAHLVPASRRLLLTGFAADKDAVVSGRLATYGIVHFGVHGILDAAQPEMSSLVFSLVGRDGAPQDGYLRLAELYNLRLSADLVVLGACQTALGRQIRGEGLVALTRGFFHAGASSVIAGLWRADDEATGELMRIFYQSILGPGRLQPADALRQAQLAVRGQPRWRQPYYWASFVFQGLNGDLP